MLDEKAVKEFFLETNRWVIKESPTPIMHTHFPHSRALLHNNGCLYYLDVWAEVEDKNTVQSIGHILIWHQQGPLWGMNYDGWYQKDWQAISLQKEGFKKALQEIDQEWKQTILLEKDGLKYENKASGSFSSFELKETIVIPNNYLKRFSYCTYRGRALVSLF